VQQDGNYTSGARGMVAGLSTRGTIRRERWGVFWKATGSRKQRERQFVAASCNQLGCCANGRLEDLNLVC